MPYEIWCSCPKCGLHAKGLDEINEKFGFRKVGGKQIPQSHCRACRSN